MDNTIHIYSGHIDTVMRRIATQAAQGIIEVLKDEVPTWPVNELK